MVSKRLIQELNIAEKLSMGIGGSVTLFGSAATEGEVQELSQIASKRGIPLLVLGAGTNLILSDDGFDCLTLQIGLMGIRELKRHIDSVYVRVSAGENWDEFVRYCISHDFWGCENLSLIPGTVGATPIQNVGAFGQEVKNIIDTVRCYDRLDDCFVELSNAECGFASRKSIFNSSSKGRYIICSVVFSLSLLPVPRLSRKEFSGLRSDPVTSPTLLSDIRNLVVSYRTSGKNLPADPEFGSAGTFFKTAIIESNREYLRILARTFLKLGPKAAVLVLGFTIKYRSPEGFKIPSKFLIQLCGLSRTCSGEVFLLSTNPACVVTNRTKSPSSNDLSAVIDIVSECVLEKTGILIPIEPEMIGFQHAADNFS